MASGGDGLAEAPRRPRPGRPWRRRARSRCGPASRRGASCSPAPLERGLTCGATAGVERCARGGRARRRRGGTRHRPSRSRTARDGGQDVAARRRSRIPLPFVQRNQGEREAARATLARSEAELGRAGSAVEADVHRAWEAYDSGTRREADLRRGRPRCAGAKARSCSRKATRRARWTTPSSWWSSGSCSTVVSARSKHGAISPSRRRRLARRRHLPQTHARAGGTE